MEKKSTKSGKECNGEKEQNLCYQCIKSLHLLIDGEAKKEEEEFLINHINDCLPCYNQFKLDKTVKEVVQKRVEKKTVPQSLLDEIRSKLQETVK